MEQLPQTKGKGVLMFAKRRQRMDEISAEHEEMRLVDSVAGPESETVNTLMQRGSKASQDIYIRQYQEQPFQQSASGTNGLDPHQDWAVPRQLVSNRTAKPFLGGDNQGQNTFSPVKGVLSPTPKKHDNIFKVPVPVNTAPHVWSPTSDIIASRDERIAIPAIKTGILPETKRRGAIKTELKETSLHQKKGRSFTDSVVEEDFLSLGAEACNFMQAPSVKLKKPPPVLPKPVLNTAHPPWSTEGHITSKSPVMTSSSVHGLGINLMDPLAGSIVKKQSSAFWTTEAHQVKQTPDSTRAGSSQSATPLVRPPSAANSVASCPPQHLCKSLRTKAPIASQQDCSTETRSSEGLHLKGKGAELFARRQTRMEKYVVDDETVRANKVRPSSPTLSMPSTWKYSSNVRAPPPVSYNPILSPFYPLAAIKQQPPSTSPKLKAKVNKEKKNPPPKHLNVLDVMKHQPYQLDSTLFTYSSTTDVKEEVHLKELETSAQGPNNLPAQSYQTTPNPNVPSKILHSKQSSSKDTAELRVPYPFVRQTKSNEDAGVQHLTGGHHLSFHGGSGNYMSSRNTGPAVDLHVNNQYVPRSVLSVAPKPKFSAKKSNMRGKQWKPVIAQH